MHFHTTKVHLLLLFCSFFIEKMSFSVIFLFIWIFCRTFASENLNSFKKVYHGK